MDANIGAMLQDADLRRLESYVDKTDDGCWIWTGGKSDGYGRFRYGSTLNGTRTIGDAYRIYWEHFNGPVPEGMKLIRTCTNRACVRPDHLLVGDAKDMSEIMRQHGTARTGDHRGGRNGGAKLTDRQAFDILWRDYDLNNKEVAARFGVTHHTISLLRRGKTFKHLKRPLGTPEKYHSMRKVHGSLEEVLELHRQGLGYDRISRKLSMSKSTVRRYIRKNRLQPDKASTI
jgi:DNA-binding CsgD family transcriptional regulator